MVKRKNVLPINLVSTLMRANKATVRHLIWENKKTYSNPQWVEFQTACRVNNAVREDVFFIASYRAKKYEYDPEHRGGFVIEQSEKFNAALMIGPNRVFAIDIDDTPHTNKKGIGLPYFKKTIESRAHIHIWCGQGYGYAEPFEDIDTVENLLDVFQARANLVIMGGIVHPMKGIQPRLL